MNPLFFIHAPPSEVTLREDLLLPVDNRVFERMRSASVREFVSWLDEDPRTRVLNMLDIPLTGVGLPVWWVDPSLCQ